ESVPSGGGSQDIIADHQGHQAIIEQRTQDSNIRNDVKHQVDNMVTEYRGNIGDTQNSIRGEENIVSCPLNTSPTPRDLPPARMPASVLQTNTKKKKKKKK
ncbi:hypothetical protein, partial [Escherichia coli]|uniref:hypothetical protein n=1 Tax=Escherichia coli TaxID=562 RepID=UPI002024ADA2